MSRQRKPPAYLLHKATGQARVRINGKDVYLGPFDSPDSKERYREVLQEWGCGERIVAAVSIGVLCLRYLDYAKGYYLKNGKQTSEVSAIQVAMRFLTVDRYKNLPARDFKTAALLEVREAMVKRKLVRKSVNCQINRIRRMFAWGVESLRQCQNRILVAESIETYGGDPGQKAVWARGKSNNTRSFFGRHDDDLC